MTKSADAISTAAENRPKIVTGRRYVMRGFLQRIQVTAMSPLTPGGRLWCCKTDEGVVLRAWEDDLHQEADPRAASP